MARMRVCLYLVGLIVAGVLVGGCHLPGGGVQYLEDDEAAGAGAGERRVTREVTLDERTACGPNVSPEDVPPNRVDTRDRVAQLRDEMLFRKLDAYIIPTDDEHQSEYVAPADERRRYISGFSGSAGTAVVTADNQALWTDGRYFLQADQQLDCSWLLMKQKNPGVPKMVEWLQSTLISGVRVGADPKLIGAESWMSYAEDLAKANITLVAEETNLVDVVWPETERPQYSEEPIIVLGTQFAGKPWEEKVQEVRQEMVSKGADLLVVTALDEVAWLLNLRGSDIPYNPVFRGYVLLWQDKVELYVPRNKITPAVDNHLNVNQCQGKECVTINDYAAVLDSLRALKVRNNVKKVMVGAKYSYSGGASYAVFSAVPEELRMKDTSPVLLMKARKNLVEAEGMMKAHVKDAVALCDFLSYLEIEIVAGRYWSEISAAERLEEFRAQQPDFMGISFKTISAFGSNGAVVHYEPTEETNQQITQDSLYLLDSGGQYKDGTTDVTRTLHYGTPTPFQVEAYTRVLMGAIDLASLVFPEGTGDTDVDILARRHLYAVGLDYRHGTGHGIGMFLNVHEAPIQVRIYGGEEHAFEVGHFFSDEPGFYQDGEFGIRLENILTVVTKKTPYRFDKQSLGFEPVTLVPFEPLLINASMLTARQCQWLNSYHARVREVVGGELKVQSRTRGYEWVAAKTEPLPCVSGYQGPSAVSSVKMQKTHHEEEAEVVQVEEVVKEPVVNKDGARNEAMVQEEPEPEEEWKEYEEEEEEQAVRKLSRVSLMYRVNCSEGDIGPPTRVNTSIQVADLLEEMELRNLSAYIVPIAGEQDGFTMAAEERLAFLTGFTGSNGVAVVTPEHQALWTDGRYFLQAEDELDCDWILMKDGLTGVPKPIDWLKEVLVKGEKVAADPKLVAADTWKKYEEELAASGVKLVAEEINLVDLVWPADERPAYPQDPVYVHEFAFAGKRWEDKVKEVREEMIKKGADVMVVTAADEVAWLLNLRGSDAKNTPVFRGYVIVNKKGVELFIPDNKITPAVDLHLNVNQCDKECATISPYTTILSRLQALQIEPDVKKVLLASKWSYSGGASYAIYSAVPEEKRMSSVSPVLLIKARKNPTEMQGMKDAHLRDAVALCNFLAFMEREVAAGNAWNEIDAATKLYQMRQEQRHFTGLSFETISAFGPNGAVIHYRPQPDTNRPITDESLYLVDSGGQYKDGTTDVTRTLHYGSPTALQVEAYTRVLLGAIDLASLVFPKGTGDTDVDILARRPLYEVGLDYRHGTGHGIGHFLSVHEAPTQVRIYSDEEHELEVGQFFSDEPGYYQDNAWGIRLETILTVVPKETKFTFVDTTLGFEAVTLVPFEPKLINLTLFNDVQCLWLNSYHQRIRDEVGPELLSQSLGEVYDWMMGKTEALPCPNRSISATTTTTTSRQGHS